MGVPIPPELDRLQESFTEVARNGQSGTFLDDIHASRDARVVNPRLLTYNQAAVALNCHVRTVRRLCDAGELLRVKVGGAARIPLRALDEYLHRLEAPVS